MSSFEACGVNYQNVIEFDALRCLPPGGSLHPQIRGGFKTFMRSAIEAGGGPVGLETARQIVKVVHDYENAYPLYSAQPFRYPALSQPVATAENTVTAAVANAQYMLNQFGAQTFASTNASHRRYHALQWEAPLDEDYTLRVRGGSGAGTFSIDMGVGFISNSGSRPKYRELWRTGIDTENYDGFGARFIRTGSATKHNDSVKTNAFAEFRKRYNILPQRLLGVVGLYFMRELDPDYAVAMTTRGAKALSTLGRSNGGCDYTGIFGNVGFQTSNNVNWLSIPDFSEGFYGALERASIRKTEAAILDRAIDAINNMAVIGNDASEHATLFELCTDSSRETLERELALAIGNK